MDENKNKKQVLWNATNERWHIMLKKRKSAQILSVYLYIYNSRINITLFTFVGYTEA